MTENLKAAEDLPIDYDFDDFGTADDALTDAAQSIRDAASGGGATRLGIQTADLQSAMDGYAQAMNQSAIAQSTGLPVRTPSAAYKGFVAEEYFKLTLKINALAKGVPNYKLGAYTKGALPDGSTLSGIDMETDIVAFTRKRPWSKPAPAAKFQSKIHNDAAAYGKDMANAQYQDVGFVGGSGQGVNDTVSVPIGKKTISSDPITPEAATKLADAAKAQKTPEYAKAAEKHGELNRLNLGRAAAAGAATGLILTTVKELTDILKHRDNLSEDQFVQSITHILCDTAEGGIRGGAIMGSVQMLGKAVGKEIAANSLGAVPVMAAANTAVDLAKDLYKCFVTGTIDADDLLCNTVNNTFSSFAGFGGAYLGAQLAGAASVQTAAAAGAAIGSALGPIGTIIGSVVGGIVIGYGANAIIGTANKDAQKAFSECIAEMNEQIELSGCAKLYYFADTMSSISEFRLSFKDLLPCYNLISDLKEYNLHKKALKSIAAQLDASIASAETTKVEALQKLDAQHRDNLQKLQAHFGEQRTAMLDEYRESMNTYVANSYFQYMSIFEVLSGDLKTIKAQFDDDVTTHNAILDCAQKRNKVNAQLNELLADMMSDPDSARQLKPFLEKLQWFMQQDELMVGRQYLSFDEALFLVRGG